MADALKNHVIDRNDVLTNMLGPAPQTGSGAARPGLTENLWRTVGNKSGGAGVCP